MKLSPSDLKDLADLAISAASQAGQMIAQSRPTEIQHKASGTSLASQVVTEVDQRSQDMILDLLAPTFERYGIGLLTEEQADDRSRLSADHFWCIDPLDGTLPFIESAAGYAVSIALVNRDGTSCLGVVYDPVDGTVWHAISGDGTFRNGQPWPSAPLPTGDVLSVFADRSFLRMRDHVAVTESLAQIAHDMGLRGLRLETTGGAVMNACNVLAHPPACYFKYPGPTGGGSLWDFAATTCLFESAGAVVTDIHGSALDLNRVDSTFMNHRGVLFATNDPLAARLRAIYTHVDSTEQPT